VSFSVRFTEEAAEDLVRLYTFAAENDPAAADRALEMIGKTWEMLEEFPFSCRKAEGTDPFLREVIIPFGASGYVALFEIEGNDLVTVLAVRHQLEDDYH
jgi:plasmid stabilization system protein ParE